MNAMTCEPMRSQTSLARTAKGPKKAARAEFAAFEADLKEFESKALSETRIRQRQPAKIVCRSV